MKIKELADVFLNLTTFGPHAILTLAPSSGYALNLKALMKVSNVCLTSQLSYNYSLIQFIGYNSKFNFFDGVEFRKYFISLPAFYLITWLMKSPKNLEKTSILKI